MMNRLLERTIRLTSSFVLLMLMAMLPLGAKAQEVEQRIDSLQMLIGEQTLLHLKVVAPKQAKVTMPTYKAQQTLVPGVLVVEQSPVDTAMLGDDRMEFRRDYTLTSFDERVYAIPALPVKINGRVYRGNPLALKVLTVAVDTIHPDQFYPPKDVQDNPFSWAEWSWVFWLSILMLLVCGGVYFLAMRLRQNKPIVVHFRIVKRVPAHEKALNEINIIKQECAENHESPKEYYTRLTDTLREYIEHRFGFSAKEMTSSEIIQRLQDAGDSKMIDELKQLFRTADLVKFAKYETLINENDANLVNAIHFIDQTKTDEQPQEEKVAPTLSADDKKSRNLRRWNKVLLWVGSLAIIALLVYIIYSVSMLLM